MSKIKLFVLLPLILVCITIMTILVVSFYKINTINDLDIKSYYDNYNKKEYFGLLSINNLGINNIIYEEYAEENNVNKNIYLAKTDDSNKMIVLAAHSGDSPISYFKNLHLISKSDNIELIVDGRLRTYQLFFKTEVLKTGKLILQRYNYPVLILITCSKTEKNKQEIYYTRLVKSTKFTKF